MLYVRNPAEVLYTSQEFEVTDSRGKIILSSTSAFASILTVMRHSSHYWLFLLDHHWRSIRQQPYWRLRDCPYRVRYASNAALAVLAHPLFIAPVLRTRTTRASRLHQAPRQRSPVRMEKTPLVILAAPWLQLLSVHWQPFWRSDHRAVLIRSCGRHICHRGIRTFFITFSICNAWLFAIF